MDHTAERWEGGRVEMEMDRPSERARFGGRPRFAKLASAERTKAVACAQGLSFATRERAPVRRLDAPPGLTHTQERVASGITKRRALTPCLLSYRESSHRRHGGGPETPADGASPSVYLCTARRRDSPLASTNAARKRRENTERRLQARGVASRLNRRSGRARWGDAVRRPPSAL